MVKRVEAELKMDVSEDINAASITASIRPATPAMGRGSWWGRIIPPIWFSIAAPKLINSTFGT